MSVKNKSGYLFLLNEDIKNREVGENEINYKIHHFPDGEKQIELIGDFLKYSGSTVRVYARLSTLENIFLLCQLCEVFKRYNIDMDLTITYLMGQRNDRIMSFGSAVNQDIIVDWLLKYTNRSINYLGVINRINILEPHNPDSLLRLTGRLSSDSSTTVSLYKLFDNVDGGHLEDIIVFPDEGSYDRYRNNTFIKQKILNKNHIIGRKTRIGRDEIRIDVSVFGGKIKDLKNKRFVVIDDLCDGGGTFIVLANKLREKYGNDIFITLYVTHSVNSDGLLRVAKIYNRVVTTDSFKTYSQDDINKLPENIIIAKAHLLL